MTTKQLKPILKLLQAFGVSEYEHDPVTGRTRLRFGGPPQPVELPPSAYDPEMVAEQGGTDHPEEEEDPAFFLERIHRANHPGRQGRKQ